jgi:hypothetical protein
MRVRDVSTSGYVVAMLLTGRLISIVLMIRLLCVSSRPSSSASESWGACGPTSSLSEGCGSPGYVGWVAVVYPNFTVKNFDDPFSQESDYSSQKLRYTFALTPLSSALAHFHSVVVDIVER